MLDGYAVFDFETTGLKAKGQDRVAEIGLVLLDQNGNFESEFTTLINPKRDLGPTHIHHIKGMDVVDAPAFSEVASFLSNTIRNRLLVAHNARFDVGFLDAELKRALPELHDLQISWLCTMDLARDFLPGGSRSLDGCCAAFDIEIEAPHHALADARATAELLRSYMELSGDPAAWKRLLDRSFDWPTVDSSTFEPKARPMVAFEEPFLLAKVSRMPDTAETAAENEFLAVLDRVLADGIVTVQESQELLDAAAKAEITPQRLVELRKVYFYRLVDLVWDDGILTSDEEIALDKVAEFMGIPDEILASAKLKPFEKSTIEQPVESDFSLEKGALVVLTGDMVKPRSHYEELVISAGFNVAPAVTKKVSLVVAADATSISGKARKARDYGIPIVQLEDFLAYLGI